MAIWPFLPKQNCNFSIKKKKVDRIATFPTIKNRRCLISFPGFFFLLEFMFMVFFFPFLLTWKMKPQKKYTTFPQIFPNVRYKWNWQPTRNNRQLTRLLRKRAIVIVLWLFVALEKVQTSK